MELSMAKKGTRVTFTKAQLAGEAKPLLTLLEALMEDGVVDVDEVHTLNAALGQFDSDTSVQGIHFLRDEVAAILEDGVVDDAERVVLRRAILRVMPKAHREQFVTVVAEAEAVEKAARAKQREEAAAQDKYMATAKQRAFIRDLGGTCPADATKIEASELIDELLETRPTVRQRMVLRFWNRLDLMDAGVDGVSDWMDDFYDEDPRRELAWTLWKRENGDTGGRNPKQVERVPIGAGPSYLKRVGITGTPSAQYSDSDFESVKSNQAGVVALVVVGLLVLIGVALLSGAC